MLGVRVEGDDDECVHVCVRVLRLSSPVPTHRYLRAIQEREQIAEETSIVLLATLPVTALDPRHSLSLRPPSPPYT